MSIDPDRLHRAMLHMAYLVERYGNKYAPEFERLADAWEALQSRDSPAARARRLLAAHTIPHPPRDLYTRDGGLKAIR
jgi:hypothetical protein